MFELKQSGSTAGDCTAPYDVILTGEYTVKQFIDEVLSRKEEWGVIDNFRYKPVQYKYGKLLTLPEKLFLNSKIRIAYASGGWSRMDYILKLVK